MTSKDLLHSNLREYIQDLEDAATDIGALAPGNEDGCTEQEFNQAANRLEAARTRLEKLVEYFVTQR